MHHLQVIALPQQRLVRLGAGEVGRRIRAARLARKLSQQKLAKAIGLSQNSLQKIENGLTENSRFLALIWAYLGLPLAELNEAFGAPIVPLPPANDLIDYSGKAHLIASTKSCAQASAAAKEPSSPGSCVTASKSPASWIAR